MGYLNNLRPAVGGGLGGIPKRKQVTSVEDPDSGSSTIVYLNPKEDSIFFKRAGDGMTGKQYYGGNLIDLKSPGEPRTYYFNMRPTYAGDQNRPMLMHAYGENKDKLLMSIAYNNSTTSTTYKSAVGFLDMETDSFKYIPEGSLISETGQTRVPFWYFDDVLHVTIPGNLVRRKIYQGVDLSANTHDGFLDFAGKTESIYGVVQYQDVGTDLPVTAYNNKSFYYDDKYILELVYSNSSVGFRLLDKFTGELVESNGTSSVLYFWFDNSGVLSQPTSYVHSRPILGIDFSGDYPMILIGGYNNKPECVLFENGIFKPPTARISTGAYKLSALEKSSGFEYSTILIPGGYLRVSGETATGAGSDYTKLHMETYVVDGAHDRFIIELDTSYVFKNYPVMAYTPNGDLLTSLQVYRNGVEDHTLLVLFTPDGLKKVLKFDRANLDFNLSEAVFTEDGGMILVGPSGPCHLHFFSADLSDIPLDTFFNLFNATELIVHDVTSQPIITLTKFGPNETPTKRPIDQDKQYTSVGSTDSNYSTFYGNFKASDFVTKSRVAAGTFTSPSLSTSDKSIFDRKL